MKKAAVIIVSFNGLKFLNECLDALNNQTYKNFDIYFVDNGSIDGSYEFVQTKFPKAKLIQQDKNYGFAQGNNVAIRQALKDSEVDYIVCLNNDTKVDKRWLEELIAPVQSDPSIGMAASKSYFPSGLIQNAGIEVFRNKFGFYIEAKARGGNIDDKTTDKYNTQEFIFGPSGNAALYTRKFIETVGMFDEDFFAYIEDVDLALRGQNKGYKCIYNPKSTLIHYHSQTGKSASPFKAFMSKRNLFFMAIKNFGFFELITFPITDLLWNFRSMKSENSSVNILQDKIGLFGMIKIILRIYLSVLINFPRMFLKRFKIQKY